MFDKQKDHETHSMITPIKHDYTGNYFNHTNQTDQEIEDDQDIIILNDDDFIQATFNLFNSHNQNLQTNEINEIKPFLIKSPSQTSDLLIDLIDLTTCDNFDLNDLFLENSNYSNTQTNTQTNSEIKNEFDFKIFNYYNKNEEIIINDDDLYGSDHQESDRESAQSLFNLSLMNSTDKSESKKELKCKFCSKIFNKTYNFKRHLLQHQNNTIIENECPNCKRKILDKSNFHKHFKICCKSINKTKESVETTKPKEKSKTSERFQCEFCSKIFNKKFNFLRHLKTHSLSNNMNFPDLNTNYNEFFNCGKCKRCFVEKKQLNAHFETWHLANISCKFCKIKRIFNEKFEYLKHLNQFHSFKFHFECSFCNKSFRFYSHFQQHKSLHEEIHTSNFSYQADSINLLNKQEVKKDITETYKINQCKICGKKFDRIFNYRRHVVKVHKL